MPTQLSAAFVTHASEILANALTGSQIVKKTAAFAVEYNVEIPYATYPFAAPNKRTVLFENVMAFSEPQRYRIIRELCDDPKVRESGVGDQVRRLKVMLISRYGHLASSDEAVELEAKDVDETRHWLDLSPEALSLYNQALEKYQHGFFARNLLDDLRLSLEKLLQKLLGNEKSLENQMSALGRFVTEKRGSTEFANMFSRIIDYYAKYQNTYVKHDDAVIEHEVQFVFELTSTFMRQLVRLFRSPEE